MDPRFFDEKWMCDMADMAKHSPVRDAERLQEFQDAAENYEDLTRGGLGIFGDPRSLDTQSIHERMRELNAARDLDLTRDLRGVFNSQDLGDLNAIVSDARKWQHLADATLGEQSAASAVRLANDHVFELTQWMPDPAILSDAKGLAQTLRKASDILSYEGLPDLFRRADAQTLIREAELSEPALATDTLEIEDVPFSVPDWMQNLGREELAQLCWILAQIFNALAPVYAISVAVSDGRISAEEVGSVLSAIGIAWFFAHLLLKRKPE